MAEYFHQLGGRGSTLNELFRLHNTYGSDRYERVAADIFSCSSRPEGLDMVLGIEHNGASYLLVPAKRAEDIADSLRRSRPRHPRRAELYESLSPIVFRAASELAQKLDDLTPTKVKGKGDRDTSKANKMYQIGSDDGITRGMFEHCRVLYRIREHDGFKHEHYSLTSEQARSLKVLQVVSFTPVFWSRNPTTVLDVGYVKCLPGSFSPASSSHLSVGNNRLLDGDKRIPFSYGQTEEVDQANMEKALGELFSQREPMLLLVWNREKTLGYLKRCGFDTSGWRIGLKALFDYSHRPPPTVQVCVIDVKLLCEQVFSGRQAVESLQHAATLLKLSIVQGQCAGNDARLILEMFSDIASGTSIDEQKVNRQRQAAREPTPPPAPPVQPQVEDDDSDEDPNDYVPPAATAAPAAAAVVKEGGGYYSDADSDYGLDSDDD